MKPFWDDNSSFFQMLTQKLSMALWTLWLPCCFSKASFCLPCDWPPCWFDSKGMAFLSSFYSPFFSTGQLPRLQHTCPELLFSFKTLIKLSATFWLLMTLRTPGVNPSFLRYIYKGVPQTFWWCFLEPAQSRRLGRACIWVVFPAYPLSASSIAALPWIPSGSDSDCFTCDYLLCTMRTNTN